MYFNCRSGASRDGIDDISRGAQTGNHLHALNPAEEGRISHHGGGLNLNEIGGMLDNGYCSWHDIINKSLAQCEAARLVHKLSQIIAKTASWPVLQKNEKEVCSAYH